MKRNIRLVGLDLDGTVFNDNRQITDITKEAIKKAIEHGVTVIPVTGRPLSGLPTELFEAVPEIKYALTANGALGVELKTQKVLIYDAIPYERALELVTMFSKQDILVEPYIEGEAYTQVNALDNIMHFVNDAIFADYFLNNRNAVEDIAEFVRELEKPVEKIHLMFADQELRSETRKLLLAMPDLTISSANGRNLEINSGTANKGTSLIKFGKMQGIAREEIMVCGDSDNDVEMLKEAGFSVAMGNATPELKELADFVTLTNNEDGVAYAFQKFILNG